MQLANITVYHIMREAVYSKPLLMNNVKEAKRYIDDGAGFYAGYRLFIDESMIKELGDYVLFIDIQFCFDLRGRLQTDLYVKPTDARSYLNFNSAHPRHTFSGIVYSQCLRLRRIINNQNRLAKRLNELN